MACRKKPDENPAQSKIQEDEKAVHIQVKRAPQSVSDDGATRRVTVSPVRYAVLLCATQIKNISASMLWLREQFLLFPAYPLVDHARKVGR